MSTMYTVFLHFKQGDDLNHHLEHENDPAKAFSSWSDQLKAASETAARIGQAIKGYNISVCADTHHISLDPQDERACGLMEVLAKEELVNAENYDDDE